MTFFELKTAAKTYQLFKLADVCKWFPQVKKNGILNQLSMWSKKGHLERLKRAVYGLADFELTEPFVLTNFLYSPSYISLETALNYYSIIPDIPFITTCITVNKTQTFKTKRYGTFSYSHIKSALFFGFQIIAVGKLYSYAVAVPEKALFDYLYLNVWKTENLKGFIKELRLSIPSDFNWRLIQQWSLMVNRNNKNFHQAIALLMSNYA